MSEGILEEFVKSIQSIDPMEALCDLGILNNIIENNFISHIIRGIAVQAGNKLEEAIKAGKVFHKETDGNYIGYTKVFGGMLALVHMRLSISGRLKVLTTLIQSKFITITFLPIFKFSIRDANEQDFILHNSRLTNIGKIEEELETI